LQFDRFDPERFAPIRNTPEKFTPLRSKFTMVALDRFEPGPTKNPPLINCQLEGSVGWAPLTTIPAEVTALRVALDKLAPVIVAPVKFAPACCSVTVAPEEWLAAAEAYCPRRTVQVIVPFPAVTERFSESIVMEKIPFAGNPLDELTVTVPCDELICPVKLVVTDVGPRFAPLKLALVTIALVKFTPCS